MLNKKTIIIMVLIFSVTMLKNLFSGGDTQRKRRGCHRQMTFYDDKPIVKQSASDMVSPLRQSEKSGVKLDSRHDYTISEKGNLEITYKDLQIVKAYRATNPNGCNETITYVYFVKTAQ